MLPYYYVLGRQAYIPKTNPDLGYFMPKSPEAWLFLIAALSFLALSLTALAFFVRRGGFVIMKNKFTVSRTITQHRHTKKNKLNLQHL